MRFAKGRIRKWHLAAAALIALASAGTALAVVGTFQATGINGITVKTNSGLFGTSSTAFVTIPDTTVDVTVPGGQQAYVRARFSAESQCTNGEVSNNVVAAGNATCLMRFVIDGSGSNMNPPSGSDFAFDSVSTQCCATPGPKEAHSTERISALLGPGTHTVKVQVAVNLSGTMGFVLDDWAFSVERLPVPGGAS
jgi:hypothetical protein